MGNYKLILVILALLFTQSSFAVTIPTGAPIVTFGTATNPATISPGDLADSATQQIFSIQSGYFSTNTLYTSNAFSRNGVLYRVSSGKKAYCFSGSVLSGGSSPTAAGVFQLASSTSPVAAAGQADPLAGGKWSSGADSGCNMVTGPTVGVASPIAGSYVFDALSYPAVQVCTNATISVTYQCYEK